MIWVKHLREKMLNFENVWDKYSAKNPIFTGTMPLEAIEAAAVVAVLSLRNVFHLAHA